ncbi:MAG: SUMF1/EgtB/PvdO family nonheme iron enzyme, partial [Anaerolineales bacterium]|nr:SUMF1/EgtB/PvdO family nonheme iron enzyme [Anaerolineales bacterium]
GAVLDAPPPLVPNARDGRDLSLREYPWGDAPTRAEIAAGLFRANDEAAGIGNTTAVGSFPAGASPVGCLDLSGNVWEWTRSFYGKLRPYRLSPEYETTDPRNRKDMFICGGAYYVNYTGCSARYWLAPLNHFNDNSGFRVAVSPFVSDR